MSNVARFNERIEMKSSSLHYICYDEQVEYLRQIDDKFFLIRKKGENRDFTYQRVGGYFIKCRMPLKIVKK